MRAGRHAGEVVTLGLASLAAVLGPLFAGWFAGASHPNAIGGLVPWNDAAGYYNCAVAVLDGGTLNAFCERRPAYPLYLAGLLALAGGELQRALVLQALFTAGAVWVAAAMARASWGLAAGLAAAAIMAAFAATIATTTLTENLGLVLGAAGIALFASGAASRSAPYLAGGAFILAVAINARAGAFLALPLLVAWPFLAPGLPRGAQRRAALAIAVGAIAGFVPGILLAAIFGGGAGAPHANFSYTLYGLVSGGERWTHAVRVLTPDDGGALTPATIYAAAWELFLQQPHLLARGLLQGLLEHVQRLLAYVPWAPARVAAAACWLWGVACLLRHGKSGMERAFLLLVLGVLASAPVLAIEGDPRVFAATIALDAVVVSYGLARMVRTIGDRPRRPLLLLPATILAAAPAAMPGDARAWGVAVVAAAVVALVASRPDGGPAPGPVPPHPVPGGGAAGLALVVLAIIVVIPVAARMPLQPAADGPRAAAVCAGGERTVIARPGRDSVVLRIVGQDGEASVWPVAVTERRFREGLSPLTARYEELLRLKAGTVYMLAHDLGRPPEASVRVVPLLGNGATMPTDGRRYAFCVGPDPASGLEGVDTVRSITPLD
ncbi:MAG: hypothetical protein AB7N54_07125 [Alphaproteobacteria bacterium]